MVDGGCRPSQELIDGVEEQTSTLVEEEAVGAKKTVDVSDEVGVVRPSAPLDATRFDGFRANATAIEFDEVDEIGDRSLVAVAEDNTSRLRAARDEETSERRHAAPELADDEIVEESTTRDTIPCKRLLRRPDTHVPRVVEADEVVDRTHTAHESQTH